MLRVVFVATGRLEDQFPRQDMTDSAVRAYHGCVFLPHWLFFLALWVSLGACGGIIGAHFPNGVLASFLERMHVRH